MDKNTIRRHILALRAALPEDIRRRKDEAIFAGLRALPAFSSAGSVLLYASFGSEVSTREIMEYCLARGVIVSLPRVVSGEVRLEIHRVLSPDELVQGYRGIPEPPPSPETRMTIDEVDLIVTPGVAFDEGLSRIGYGKGYYDRLLGPLAGPAAGQRPFLAGIAFEEQIVPSISRSAYDINMDAVITDKRTIFRHGS
jgi:5-formyltetrahydrofolate cyclo-ligase